MNNNMSRSNALGLLIDYGDNESSSEEDKDYNEKSVTNQKSHQIKPKNVIIQKNVDDSKKLPLPFEIRLLYKDTESSTLPIDDPELHDGRIRSFAHQRGNWSTYVFVPFLVTTEYTTMCEDLIAVGKEHSVDLKSIQEPHLSLTRTVVLLHHWIESFVKSVKESLSIFQKFFIEFGGLKVYCNEENSRTFLGITVKIGEEVLHQCVKNLDQCLAEFKLPPFYKEPSFHLSIAWTLGDQKEALSTILPLLEDRLLSHFGLSPELSYLEVGQILCKSGNKVFAFDLN